MPCPRNRSTRPPRMSPCSIVILMWDQHQRILSMPILSSMSAQIYHQPSLNAQWQQPRCEDPILSSDRAARWTAQPQEGTRYRCQQSDLIVQELVYVCVCGREGEIAQCQVIVGSTCADGARVCVEMKINEWESWMCVCARDWRVSGSVSKENTNLSSCLPTMHAHVCVCIIIYSFF